MKNLFIWGAGRKSLVGRAFVLSRPIIVSLLVLSPNLPTDKILFPKHREGSISSRSQISIKIRVFQFQSFQILSLCQNFQTLTYEFGR